MHGGWQTNSAITPQSGTFDGTLFDAPPNCNSRRAPERLKTLTDSQPPSAAVSAAIERIYRDESRRIFATLVRLLQDFDAAEEALHEAFAAAVTQWEQSGIPDNPRAWLVSTGRFRAIDALRRQGRLDEHKDELARRSEATSSRNHELGPEEFGDDRLRLIFTCCHPAIDQSVQVPLTLREVCGLTTEQIANAFLTTAPAMAQRIVRGKAKIRDAGIPYVVPDRDELPIRLDAVLAVIYLVYNEGYSASSGDSLTRPDLSGEAIRLGRLLNDLLPDPEAQGLLALMLLQESRRTARTGPDGDLILLEDQDRSLWNRDQIAEGGRLIRQSLGSGRAGIYSVQAAIALVHAEAPTAAATDWDAIVAWYDLLVRVTRSAVIELNRAVAIAMRDGPEAGLALIESLLHQPELRKYHLAHAARADFCRRLGKVDEARAAYQQAISLTRQDPERRYLQRRLDTLSKEF